MSPTIIFLVVLSIGLLQSVVPSVHNACEVDVSTSGSPCNGLINVVGSCNESIADFGETTLKSCEAVSLIWMYPMKNLTITIETPYTQRHQEYSIRFDNTHFFGSSFKLYRILNGEERRINTADEYIIEKSDSNYQIKLKMQAPYTVSLYILNLDYTVMEL